MAKKETSPVIQKMDKLGSLSAREIPLGELTIEKLGYIMSKTIRVNGCRLFLNPHHTGYGFVSIKGIKYPAHRVVKVASTGDNGLGMVVDHLCKNKSCIRPSHLEFVTQGENISRGVAWRFLPNFGVTECKHGHSLANAYISTRPTGQKRRSCRECHRINESKRRERLRNA